LRRYTKYVYWDKSRGKWQAKSSSKGKHLGYHATEEAAAQAYDNYADDGVDPVKRRSSQFKVVCGSTHRGNNAAAPAALTPLYMVAPAYTHAGVGSKRSRRSERADARTTPAPPQRKKMRLDGGVTGCGGGVASGGVTGGGAASGGVTVGGAASGGVTGAGASSGSVTGGGAASGGVTCGGAAGGGLTRGRAASGGVTGGGVASTSAGAAAGAWAAAAAAAQRQHPLWWKFASAEARNDLTKAKAEVAKSSAKVAK
jgi:hypothetical protein